MKKISSPISVEPITPSTESFALQVFADPSTRRNLIGPDLAPGSFQRWLYGTATRLLLCRDSRPVGVLNLVGTPPRCFFGYALAPEFRGQGLASPCLVAIEKYLVTKGYKTITTNVACDNAPSIRALDRAAFRRFQWLEKGAVE
jgi:RimJ/RimL family protein N-acetyltransferase